MKFSKIRLPFTIVAIVFVMFFAAPAAHADSYELFDLGSGHLRNLMGITSSGTAVVYASSLDCGGGGPGCFETMVDGVIANESPTNPGLTFDSGNSCTIAVPPALSLSGSLTGVCNNGHEVYWTDALTPPPYAATIFDGPNLVTDVVATGIVVDPTLRLNAAGDFAFPANEGTGIDGDGEIYEEIDLTTAATPEPGSLWLLATGTAGAIAMIRRRRVRSN